VPAPKGNQYAVDADNGRPSKYISEYAKQARRMCERGATDADLAYFFNVSIQTIANWCVRYEDFLAAVKLGKDAADELMVRSLYQRGRGFTVKATKFVVVDGNVIEREYDEYYPPETKAAMNWLANRRRGEWTQQETNVNVDVSGSVQHQHTHRLLTPEELAALPFDEVQRLAAEEIALSQGVSLLPPPKAAGDAPVRDET
jgi:hypothetical protein